MAFDESIESYLSCLNMLHYSRDTIRSTRYMLHWFADWCLARGIESPDRVRQSHLEQFQHWLFRYRKEDGKPLALETQQIRLIVIRRFFFWLAKRGVVQVNPAAELELPRGRHRLPKGILTHLEVSKILRQPDVETVLGLRDRAILEVLYATGVRRKELCNLKCYDLNMQAEVLMVRQGKGDRDRLVPISSRAVDWVIRYIDHSRVLLLHSFDPGHLFLGRLGHPLCPDSLSRIVRSYAKKAGIQKPGACHLFRHTMATEMLENGADIRYIQEMLGHQRLNSTQIYTQVSIKKLKEVHMRTHPGAKIR